MRFNIPETNRISNKIRTLKYDLLTTILLCVFKYFSNLENIYFLILSMFQLSTLFVLPKHWSPTGPYSTFIPLLICIIAEVVSETYSWLKFKSSDRKQNNILFDIVDGKIKNESLYPGYVIKLYKNDICPVDGILLDVNNNHKYAKTSMALLTGETNVCYVLKASHHNINFYKNFELLINEYYPTKFKELDALIRNNTNNIKVNGNNFITAGSIILSDEVHIWITACGKEKKSYLVKQELSNKYSRIDSFVGKYMMNVNLYILLALIFVLSISQDISMFPIYCIQNWILFNGIMPFSVKLLIILARNLQSKNRNIIINNSSQIDDVHKIVKIISDKTGTITKNELEFTNILEKNSNQIISLESPDSNTVILDLEFHKCLGLCIHQEDGNFSTTEDKIIRYRYNFLNNTISQNGNKIKLKINVDSYETEHDFTYIEIGGLDFTFDRKMSSKVVKYENDYYIYCKGSIDMMTKRVIEKEEIARLDHLMTQQYPELRLLACAYRKLDEKDITNLDLASTLVINELENNLTLLGLIGIKDNLQENICETVNDLKKLNLQVSLCTGDRKITALSIANLAGLTNTNNIIDITSKNDCMQIYNMDLTDITICFNGNTFDEITKNTIHKAMFNYILIHCKNFVGYNLMPEHKRKITSIFESNNIKTLAIGDGYNDIGMFDVSSISVSVKGNNNSFIESYTDFSIKQFSDLTKLFDISADTYKRNSTLINFTFYRCATVIFSLVTYCLLTQTNTSLFDGFVIQAFNFAWNICGLVYFTIMQRNNSNLIDNFNAQKMHNLNMSVTSKWNIGGIFTGIFTTLICYMCEYNIHNSVPFLIITIMNVMLWFNTEHDIAGTMMSLIGSLLFVFYIFIKSLI